MTPFTHQHGHTLLVDDAQLYYEESGNPQGPVLLLLHGGLGTLETFNPLLPALGERFRLIGLDSRGHGASTLGSAALSYARLERDVQALVAHLQVPGISVIGHSDGGIVGLRLAAAGALKVDKLVCIGAHWALPKHDPTRALYQRISAEAWREMFPEEVARYEALNPQANFERLLEAVRGMWLASDASGYPGDSVRQIKAEVLVVRGDDDPLVSRGNVVELTERVAGARLFNLPFAEHSLHESATADLLPTLRHFLEA
ncbi:alpha/beta fold hydrolase [Pseudomonas cremoricolorata]|uniref:alpha/beta fold hydrolase n=1 Tax=Pseudomonas cremoricolorata TaxID=157783 RepID=UPI0004140084|nr:alpha/beta hydrolase [Pseudomonas cremoricolorata]